VTHPKGIFDRSTKGSSTPPIQVLVERGRLQFFSGVLREVDPIHTSLDAARAKGNPDIVAPPSFFMVIEALANDELRRRGEKTAIELVRCDFRYLLHGDETYRYLDRVYAGDTVTLTTTIVDFFDKKGGVMEFVTMSSVVSHPQRGELIRATRTLLHRLA
jgi:acyl dehydratase